MSKGLRDRKMTIGDDETPTAGAAAADAAAASSQGATGSQTKKKKYPCGKCEEEVTTKSLQCQTCEVWYHYNCITGMTKEFFDSCKAAREMYGYSGFLCQVCRKVVAKFNRSMKDLESEIEKLKERVTVLEKEKETLTQRIENTEMKTTKVSQSLEGVEKEVVSGMEKAKEEVKKDVSKEMKEREERSQNVVLYGVVEATSESADERKEEDGMRVKEVMEAIGVEGEMEVKFRAGKKAEGPDSRPRPLIISIKDDEVRERIMRDARKLSKIPQMKTVYVATDMTWAQREEARRMEKELREEAERKTQELRNEQKNGRFIVVGPRGKRRLVRTEKME